MTRKPRTVAEKKAAIKTWRAKFDGNCGVCKRDINKGRDLVTRHPKFTDHIIHYSCHPDWRPALMPGYDINGRKIKDGT